MQTPNWSQYLNGLFATMVAVIALCGAINIVVDPLGIFGSPRVPGFNATKPYLDHHKVLARWQRAKRLCPTAGIFGNSRAEIGFDPEHSAFDELELIAFNHAIPGSSIDTSVRQIAWLQEAGCPPRVIVLGLEFFDFLGGSPAEELEHSSPPPAIDGVVLAETVFSITALRDSLATIQAQGATYPATLTERGFNPLLNYIPEVKTSGHFILFRQRAVENLKNWSRKPRRIKSADGTLSADFVGLESFLKAAGESGSTVHLVVYPYHAEIRLMMDRLGLGSLFTEWKENVVRTADKFSRNGLSVDVTDFSGVTSETSEAIPPQGDRSSHLKYYWEAGHFKKALGDRVLERVLLGKSEFGVRLTPETLPAFEKSDRERLQDVWASRSPIAQEVEMLFVR